MNIEKNVKEFNELYCMLVKSKGNQLILKLKMMKKYH